MFSLLMKIKVFFMFKGVINPYDPKYKTSCQTEIQ